MEGVERVIVHEDQTVRIGDKTLADLRITVIFEDQLPPERIISFVGSDKEEESQHIYLG